MGEMSDAELVKKWRRLRDALRNGADGKAIYVAAAHLHNFEPLNRDAPLALAERAAEAEARLAEADSVIVKADAEDAFIHMTFDDLTVVETACRRHAARQKEPTT